MDPAPAPDPVIFVLDLQDANKKPFFLSFSADYFLKGTFTSFFYKIKIHKEVTKQ
jgi:hypothetical protein